jgi:hypothetical protein
MLAERRAGACRSSRKMEDGRLGSRLRGCHTVAPRSLRHGPFVHRLYFRSSSPEALHVKRHDRPLLGRNWACDSDLHVNRRVLLHAANLRHGTDGFTSPPKEGILWIFFARKIRRLRTRELGYQRSACLPLDHRSRYVKQEKSTLYNYMVLPVSVRFVCSRSIVFQIAGSNPADGMHVSRERYAHFLIHTYVLPYYTAITTAAMSTNEILTFLFISCSLRVKIKVNLSLCKL